MNKLQDKFIYLFYATVLLCTVFQSSTAQSYCHILEDEYNIGAITKAGEEYLAIQGPGSIWRSSDEINWIEDEIAAFANVDSFGFPVAITFFDEKNGIAASISNPDATKSSLYHTKDGGVSWTRSKLMLQDSSIAGFFPLQLFALDEETVVMTQVFKTNFFISHDRGVTWSSSNDFTQSASNIMDITFIDKETWLLPTYKGLYKTTDQLASTSLLIDKNFIQFYASADSPYMYGLTFDIEDGFDLYFSEDEFATWDSTSIQDQFPEFNYISSIINVDSVLYLFEGENMQYSMDHGQSWTKSNLANADRYGAKVTLIDGNVYSHRGNMIKLNCMSVGTQDRETDIDLLVYPNPSDGKFYFKNPMNSHLHFNVFDNAGKKIMDGAARNSIDLSNFSQGIYFLQLLNPSNNEMLVEKLVINR